MWQDLVTSSNSSGNKQWQDLVTVGNETDTTVNTVNNDSSVGSNNENKKLLRK